MESTKLGAAPYPRGSGCFEAFPATPGAGTPWPWRDSVPAHRSLTWKPSNAPITASASQTGIGNYKIVTAFLYFAGTSMFLAMEALAGTHFTAVVWMLPLVIPMTMGITGWNIGRQLSAEEERQQADISRWDV